MLLRLRGAMARHFGSSAPCPSSWSQRWQTHRRPPLLSFAPGIHRGQTSISDGTGRPALRALLRAAAGGSARPGGCPAGPSLGRWRDAWQPPHHSLTTHRRAFLAGKLQQPSFQAGQAGSWHGGLEKLPLSSSGPAQSSTCPADEAQKGDGLPADAPVKLDGTSGPGSMAAVSADGIDQQATGEAQAGEQTAADEVKSELRRQMWATLRHLSTLSARGALEWETFQNKEASYMRSEGVAQNPKKAIVNAGLRGQGVDEAFVKAVPSEVLAVLALKYRQLRIEYKTEKRRPMWTGGINLETSMNAIISAYVEGKQRAKLRLDRTFLLLWSVSTCENLPEQDLRFYLNLARMIRLLADIPPGDPLTAEYTAITDAARQQAVDLLSEQRSGTMGKLLPNSNAKLNDQLLEMYRAMDKDLQWRGEVVDSVVSKLSNVVHKAYPKLKLSLFGSRAVDLSLPGADVDLQIPMTTEHMADKERIIRGVADVLRKSRVICTRSQMLVLAKASTPVIKFKFKGPKGSNVPVDIAFPSAERDGSFAAAWMRDQMAELPLLRPLCLVLKAMLLQRGLNDPSQGGLGGYPLINMVVYYLRHHANQPGSGPTGNDEQDDRELNLADHLLAFLRLFGRDFDYAHRAIDLSSPQGVLCLPGNKGLVGMPPEERAERFGWLHGFAPQIHMSDSELEEAAKQDKRKKKMPSERRQVKLHIRDPVSPLNDLGRSLYQARIVRDEFRHCLSEITSSASADEVDLLKLAVKYNHKTHAPLEMVLYNAIGMHQHRTPSRHGYKRKGSDSGKQRAGVHSHKSSRGSTRGSQRRR